MSAPAVERPKCWDLVEAAQDGDPSAYGELFRTYREVVFAYALGKVRDWHVAEDITSETFVRGLRRVDSISYQGTDVGAWFVTIARNIMLDHVKSARYRLEVPCSEFTDADRGFRGSVEGAIEAEDRARTLAKYVRMLTREQAEVIRLRFYEGMEVSEAAAAMGRRDGALKGLQHRAVRRLAELVDVEAV